MPPGDMDFGLLLAMMKYLGEMRDQAIWIETRDFVDLIPVGRRKADRDQNTMMLDRYLRFLEQKGYVELGRPGLRDMNRTVRLTANGEIFVQPELAQFDNPRILSQVVESIEKEILSYPSEKREGFLFSLKEALARNAPDVAAKLIVGILPKLVAGV